MESQQSLKEHLAAIVENSDDAIVTKNLDSIILSWNRGAERLFGYSAEEAIGHSITMVIPEDRQLEEVDFVRKLRRGERISNFETIRKRKDGSLVPISLTVSPIRDDSGKIIGASKIARDITLQHRLTEQQRQLLSEMRHRVGNSFAIAGSLLSISARQVETSAELASLMRDRLLALSTAHKKAVFDPTGNVGDSTSLRDLITSILMPFAVGANKTIDVDDLDIDPHAITPLTLVLYELCTNSMKYGALGQPDSALDVVAQRISDRLVIDWQEHCALDPDLDRQPGFGTRMCDSTIRASFEGSITRRFCASGLQIRIDLDLASVEPQAAGVTATSE